MKGYVIKDRMRNSHSFFFNESMKWLFGKKIEIQLRSILFYVHANLMIFLPKKNAGFHYVR